MKESISAKRIVELIQDIRRSKKMKLIGYILTPLVVGLFILKYYNKKINDCKDEINSIENQLKKDIQKEMDWIKGVYRAIIEEDTYLIYSVRTNHLSHFDNHIGWMTKLLQYQDYFSSDFNSCFEKSKEEAIGIRDNITNFNTEFVERRKKDYDYLFKSVPFPLDDNQKNAVIKDDKHNLIVAGAGSGKTEVLTTRIAYLIERKPDTIEPDRILALAFQKNARLEMEERLKERFGLEVNIKTFHALGYEILRLADERFVLFGGDNYNEKSRRLVSNLFKEAMMDSEFQNEVINYLKSRDNGYIEEKKEFVSEKEKEEFYRYMRSLRWRTLDNTEVKSVAERDIMNFFLTHKLNDKYIKILYEEPIPWAKYIDDDGRASIPKPDFYFPEFDIWLEHWSVDENNHVPDYFEDESHYLQTMEIKKNRFEENNKTLIETKNADYYQNPDFLKVLKERILEALRKKYPEEDFIFSPIEHKELVDKVWEMCNVSMDSVAENIMNFIKISKTYGYTPEDVEERLETDKWSPMQKIFGRIACKIYRDYEDSLKSESSIDFQDMINLCIKTLQKNPKLFKDTLDHILIDEYQDISQQRYKLVKVLMDRNQNCKLSCVGDDWQSIMGFAGSNLNYFVNFGDYFDHEERTDLTINYRSLQTIVNAGADVIKNNKCKQLDKDTIAQNDKEKPIKVYSSTHQSDFFTKYYEQIAEHCMTNIDILLDNGYKPEDIMILTRIYQNPQLKEKLGNYTRRHKIRFHSVHKVKGLQSKVVFLLDVTRGLYGFPCELQDSILFEPAKEEKIVNKYDEERRLFYVALTRAKEDLIIYTQKCAESKFIDEIKKYTSYEELRY